MAKTNHVKITYHGAILIIPEWLAPLWPHDLPLHRFPSFCGAGEGWGERIIPESIRGACVSPACFIHDIDWAASPDTVVEFLSANWRFFLNCKALIVSSKVLTWLEKTLAVARAGTLWLGGVTTIGALCFNPLGDTFTDPLDNPDVQAKLRKLATARIDYYRDMGIQNGSCS